MFAGVWAWLPNAITASRGLAGLVILGLVVAGYDLWAFWFFIAAMLTDLVDGWVARRLNAVSATGQWLDPVSDKVLTDATWVTLMVAGWAPLWLAGLFLVRDAGVATAWIATRRSRGIAWKANRMGRIAVAFEGIAQPVLLFRLDFVDVHWPTVGFGIALLALAFSIGSVIQYVVDGPGER